MPQTLLPKIRSYLDRLSSQAFAADSSRGEAIDTLAKWVAGRIAAAGSAEVIVVCTGNSRRSMLGAAMGNAAASYLETPVRFSSGGTAPSAMNIRTIEALREAGFEIEPNRQTAPAGAGGELNPVYGVSWTVVGERTAAEGDVLEFSKKFSDAANPQRDFAAIMVCSEASEECPIVPGAALSVSMPFEDPKSHDGLASETMAYAERRDEIARCMLEILVRAGKRKGE